MSANSRMKKTITNSPLIMTNNQRNDKMRAALVVGAVAEQKRTTAKKRRPQPEETVAAVKNKGTGKHAKGKPQAHNKKTTADTAPPVVAKIFLRPLAMEDEAIVVRLTQEEMAPLFKETYGYDLDMSMVMGYVHSAQTRMIVVDDQVAGYVSLVVDNVGKMNIGSLILGEQYQGRGYGTRVMKQVEQEARAMGIQELEVFIQPNNTRSQAFAESLGFTQVQSPQPKTIVMVKSLRS